MDETINEGTETAAADEELAALRSENENLRQQLHEHEMSAMRQRVAAESGIPSELAERLSGENEDEMRADAEKLSALFSKPRSTPKFHSESETKDTHSAALRAMLGELGSK